MDFLTSLSESAGIKMPTSVMTLNEARQIEVADDIMTDMFKFISEKYNQFDFSEIEKSAGVYTKFKYYATIKSNLNILEDIYMTNDSKVYTEYVSKMKYIAEYLEKREKDIGLLYKKNHGIIQLYYVSAVSALIYGISGLISMTIKLVTTDKDASVDVMVDEIPNPTKYIHFRNINSVYESIRNPKEMDKLLNEFISADKKLSKGNINENILTMLTSNNLIPLIAALSIPIIIYLSTKIIPLIREIIYSVYYMRTSIANAIEVQVSLINTNIESLEDSDNKDKKTIIAKQKSIATKLTKLQKFIEVKQDKAESEVRKAIADDNKRIDVDSKVKNTNSDIYSTNDSEIFM